MSKRLIVRTDKNGDQRVSLRRQGYPLKKSDRIDSIYLSFDGLPLAAGNDRNKQSSIAQSIVGGRVLRAQYRAIKFKDAIGSAISFEQPQHQLWVDAPDYHFLNQSNHTGNFSIYFRMRPYQLKQQMEVFRKLGLFESRRQGIRCIWKNGRLSFEFLNFFRRPDRTLHRVAIATRDVVEINRFQAVLLQYHENDGSLVLYLNRKEQDKVFVTTNFRPTGSIYRPAFHRWDRSPLIIGKNYLGALDEMIFSNRILPPDDSVGGYGRVRQKDNRFWQEPGEFVGMPYTLPFSQSGLYSFHVKSEVPPDTELRLYYRFADKPFPPNIAEEKLAWLPLNTELRNVGRGRYVQWKAIFFADPQGKATPVLQSVALRYRENPAPGSPRLLEVAAVDDGAVTLRFLRNAEMDVIEGGRYHIYYGVTPSKPLGVIRFKKVVRQPDGQQLPIPITDKDRLFTSDLRYQNRIQVRVTNDMINEHIAYTRTRPTLQFPYPRLQKDVPYYFWVTACDNAWSDGLEYNDHESAPSNHVVARPR